MITIYTYSPATNVMVDSGPFDNLDVLEVFLSNKIRQYIRTRSRNRPVLFSWGVIPSLKEREPGTYKPAGVVMLDKNDMPEIIHIPRFVGTLASLAKPVTYKRYIRRED